MNLGSKSTSLQSMTDIINLLGTFLATMILQKNILISGSILVLEIGFQIENIVNVQICEY